MANGSHHLYFNGHMGIFPSILVASKGVFIKRPGDVSSSFCGDQNRLFFTRSRTISTADRSDQNRSFKPNHDIFPKCFFFFFAKSKQGISAAL